MVNPERGPGSAFPNLKVLALGRYVFSHQWQVDWIASLGRENGCGGLEELYLDSCPIMWRACTLRPLDESIIDLGGDKIDNHNYPLKEVMTRQSPHDKYWNTVTVDFDLRWSDMLRTWQDKMRSLKVFRMAGGDWRRNYRLLLADARTEHEFEEVELWARRKRGAVHVNYDQPSAKECFEQNDPRSCLRRGIGLDQDREYLLQYVHFNALLGPTPWFEQDFKIFMMRKYDDGRDRYEASRSRDEEALKELMDAVASRT